MRFNPRARIDTGQVENRSGGGGGLGGGLGGGGMRLPIPSGGGGKIGLGTVAVVIIYLVIQAIGGNNPLSPLSGGEDPASTTTDRCRTGEDANRDQSCAIDLLTNSIQNYWAQTLPQQQGTNIHQSKRGQIEHHIKRTLAPHDLTPCTFSIQVYSTVLEVPLYPVRGQQYTQHRIAEG